MAAQNVGPLDWRIPIVTEDGRPTPEFQRRWSTQIGNNSQIGIIQTGMGAPSVDPVPTDGQQYLDVTTDPYDYYVAYNGTWHQLNDISSLLDTISAVHGSILYRGASNWSALGPGTSGQFLKTNGAGADPSWAPGGGGVTTPSIRNSSIISSSSSSYVIPWPSGTVAGDRVIIFTGHGWDMNIPAGWTQLSKLTGANWNGATVTKTLDSTDIATGSVTITFAGSFNGVIATISLVGSPGILFEAHERNSGGSSSITLNTDFTPLVTDRMIYFGSNRTNSNDTVSLGSVVQTINATNASGCLYSGSPPVAGVQSPQFNYSSPGIGNYQIAILTR